MKTYEVKIQGTADMLQNRLSKELNDEIKKVPRAKKEEWEEDNWKRKLYTRTVKGGQVKVVLPELVLHSLMQEACKKYKVSPPTSIGRTWTAYFKSCVLVEDYAILDNADIEPFGTMVNGNPSSSKKSSRVYKVRPLIKKGWSTQFRVIDTAEYLNLDTVKEILTTAGMFVGLCDWRPLYGRFIVQSVQLAGGA